MDPFRPLPGPSRVQPRGPRPIPTAADRGLPPMESLDIHLAPADAAEAGLVARTRAQIAGALTRRTEGLVDVILSRIGLPAYLRMIVRPYVLRAARVAVAVVAQWIDPTLPDPV